jgi:S-adenosylmethionine hydrolase
MSLILFTDFGASDVYVGQVKAVLQRDAPGIPVVDLLHEAPDYDIESGAHLLAALASAFPAGETFLAVVDPGVGGARRAAVLLADDKWYVGPDNGLLSIVAQRAHSARTWHITWRPEHLSNSFHGRDLFAPIAAAIARGAVPLDKLRQAARLDVPLSADPFCRVIYVDHYGNCFSGIPAAGLRREAMIDCGKTRVAYARTFAEAEPGRPFWYANSVGLVEIALARASAAQALGLKIGSPLRLL